MPTPGTPAAGTGGAAEDEAETLELDVILSIFMND
jgi:hypothetical protein